MSSAASCALPARNWTEALHRSLHTIRGWVERPDLVLTIVLNSIQLASGLCDRMAVGEVGVHQGAYFAWIAAAALPGDKLFVCDLFEEGQSLNVGRSGRGSLDALIQNTRAIMSQDEFDGTRVSLVRASSLRLFDDDVRSALADDGLPPFRFLSIDGGHAEVVAFSDLRWASGRLAPGGIVALDDLANHNWVGVWRGMRDFFHLVDPRSD